jgi:hypothetical protein
MLLDSILLIGAHDAPQDQLSISPELPIRILRFKKTVRLAAVGRKNEQGRTIRSPDLLTRILLGIVPSNPIKCAGTCT